MALTTQQIQSLLNEARAAGLDEDEIRTLEWVLADRAAELDGATRLDMALLLADEAETQAADRFMVESAQHRQDAMRRGLAELDGMTDEEWERLINGD